MNNRKEEMLAMRGEGKTLSEIGKHFNITRERARQIIGTGTQATKRCEICGTTMKGFGNKKYCSTTCYNKAIRLRKRPRCERACKKCGKIFITTANSNRLYCSKKCRPSVSCFFTGDLACHIKDIAEETGKTPYAIIKEAVIKGLQYPG